MILSDSVEINATAEDIYAFFVNMEENYLRWHPDHLKFCWISQPEMTLGAKFYFEEKIANKILKKTVIVTRLVKDRKIEFTPTFVLMRLFLPRMIFRIEPLVNTSRFVAEVHLRMGPIAAKLHNKELDRR